MKKRLKQGICDLPNVEAIYRYRLMTRQDLIKHCEAYVEALHRLSKEIQRSKIIQYK